MFSNSVTFKSRVYIILMTHDQSEVVHPYVNDPKIDNLLQASL